MWLIKSSIGRKVVMSVTGIALILFLTFHASMNVVALFSAKGYNMICEFLGANWYAVVATLGLAALVALHFIYAIWLTIQNRKARGSNRYAVTDKPAKVEWASQNMLVLGIIVVLGMGLHLYNFWYNMMYAELVGVEGAIAPTDGTAFIANTFSCPCYTIVYLIWLAALWFHLNHGFWSALQTLGWNGKVWFCRWRVIGTVYSTIVVLMFAAVAILFSVGYRPADYAEVSGQPAATESVCPMSHCSKGACKSEGACAGKCKSECQGKCEGACADKCEGACAGKCEGECAGKCEGACAGKCKSECQGKCEGACGSCPNEEVKEHNHVTRDIREDCPACPKSK